MLKSNFFLFFFFVISPIFFLFSLQVSVIFFMASHHASASFLQSLSVWSCLQYLIVIENFYEIEQRIIENLFHKKIIFLLMSSIEKVFILFCLPRDSVNPFLYYYLFHQLSKHHINYSFLKNTIFQSTAGKLDPYLLSFPKGFLARSINISNGLRKIFSF